VRKPDDRRKRAREAKKERLAAAEEARREEVKRLKNLKKKEIEERWVDAGAWTGARGAAKGSGARLRANSMAQAGSDGEGCGA
jgi:protein KRI1